MVTKKNCDNAIALVQTHINKYTAALADHASFSITKLREELKILSMKMYTFEDSVLKEHNTVARAEAIGLRLSSGKMVKDIRKGIIGLSMKIALKKTIAELGRVVFNLENTKELMSD